MYKIEIRNSLHVSHLPWHLHHNYTAPRKAIVPHLKLQSFIEQSADSLTSASVYDISSRTKETRTNSEWTVRLLQYKNWISHTFNMYIAMVTANLV